MTVWALPEHVQDDFARTRLELAGVDYPLIKLSPKEEANLDLSLAKAERGEFATDAEIKAIWAKYRW